MLRRRQNKDLHLLLSLVTLGHFKKWLECPSVCIHLDQKEHWIHDKILSISNCFFTYIVKLWDWTCQSCFCACTLYLKVVLCISLPSGILLWWGCCTERQQQLWLILDPYIRNWGKLKKTVSTVACGCGCPAESGNWTGGIRIQNLKSRTLTVQYAQKKYLRIVSCNWGILMMESSGWFRL